MRTGFHWTLWIFALAAQSTQIARADVAQWDFNGDLVLSAGTGSDLVAEAALPATVASFSFVDTDISGGTAQVAQFSRGTYFRAAHGLAPNGGGARLNQYTVVLDVMFGDRSPSGGWAALLQTSPANADDSDWAVNPDGGVGISGRYGGLVTDGIWTRLVLVVDNVNHFLFTYQDGFPVSHVVGSQVSVDGRFALGPEVLLFADDNQENSEGMVNSFQIRNYALSAAEVADLGAPVSDGIPIPAFTCPRNLSVRVDRLAGSAKLTWIPGQDLSGPGYEVLRDSQVVGSTPLTGSTFTDPALPGPGYYIYELRVAGGNPFQCPQLKSRAYFPSPEEIFRDDFEGYADDADLVLQGGWLPIDENNPVEDATWTITNPGGRRNPPTEDGTHSEGNFLISDSDHACCENPGGSGMSHDLWSPSFSCAGADTVWIHFDCSAQMNNNGQCVFDVDVSTDGGQAWTNVFRQVAPSRTIPPAASTTNADGFFGRLHLDLSAQAARKTDVRVRFRHFEPNDDWWIAIDDVLVDTRPHRRGQVILSGPETFAAGIPVGWTLLSNAVPPNTGISTWTASDPCQRSIYANQGRFPYLDGRGISRLGRTFAILDDACPPSLPKDEYLITPPLDLTKATGVFLEYKSEIVVDQTTQEVLLSLDGGDTFDPTPLFSYNGESLFDPAEDPFYAARILDASAAAGHSNVVFAFHYASGGSLQYWAIGDVRVSADGNGLPLRTCPNRNFRVEGFDAVTGSVTTSWDAIQGDQGFRVLANGTVISGNLPATTLTYSDANPPAGGSITYSLQSMSGGQVEFECSAPPISVFTCPRDLACCVNQVTKAVHLSWENGLNLAGTGYRITRNGVPIRTVPLSTSSIDDTVPGPGNFTYRLILNGGDPAQCPDLPLQCDVTINGGDVLFSDGFDCYGGDDDLTAAGWEIHEENSPVENSFWTITNPGTRDNPPRPDGTPSQGHFLIADSDSASGEDATGSGMSHDIWSPVFSCAGKSKVWLHMDCSAMLNNNGEVVFDVDVTTDGGASWENLFRRVAPARGVDPAALADIPAADPGGPQVGNADGFFGPLNIDLSPVAAKKPSVRFRLRNFEPNDDWWLAVDNVVVDTTPSVGGTKVLVPNEDFSGDIPSDWQVRSVDNFSPWRATDTCFISVLNSNGGTMPDGQDGHRIHHMDETFALASIDETCAVQPQDELLVTPTVDATGVQQVYLHFKSAVLPNEVSIAEVLLSLDGGATFDEASPVFSYARGGSLLRDGGNPEAVFNDYILEVPAAVAQSKVAFGFHLKNAGTLTYWGIDDVKITAAVEGGAQPGFVRGDCNHDGVGDLSDVVYNLGYQFLGAERPQCMDSCDSNSDGADDLTDAIYLLGYLYLGGPAPPPPGPAACEKDSEPGPLGCDDPSC